MIISLILDTCALNCALLLQGEMWCRSLLGLKGLKSFINSWGVAIPTSSPGPSPHSKWQIGETPGQGCWNTTRIVEYFVTWYMMKWLFRRLFSASVGPVCFLQSETVVQTRPRHFIVFTWGNSNKFGSLDQGFLRSAILKEENALGMRLWPFKWKLFNEVHSCCFFFPHYFWQGNKL